MLPFGLDFLLHQASLATHMVKNYACNAGDAGSIENPVDRGTWQDAVHRVEELDTTEATQHACMHWRRKWQPTPEFLPGESQGQRSLVSCRLWGCTELDTTEVTQQQQFSFGIYAFNTTYPIILYLSTIMMHMKLLYLRVQDLFRFSFFQPCSRAYGILVP